MRTLAITQNITVDGSIEMLGDWFEPQGQADVDNSDLLEELHRQDSEADGFLVGRRTFEDLRGYWPQQSDDSTGISDYLNRVQKYVISSTMTDPQWQNSTVLSGDPVDEVRALKEQPGQDIVVTGSITLCHTLIEAGLVDEYRLFVYPVVQGRGRRLFPDGYECPELRLLEAKAFRSGITHSRYALPEHANLTLRQSDHLAGGLRAGVQRRADPSASRGKPGSAQLVGRGTRCSLPVPSR